MKSFFAGLATLILFVFCPSANSQSVYVLNAGQQLLLDLGGKVPSNAEQANFIRAENYKFYELLDVNDISIRAEPLDAMRVASVTTLLGGERFEVNLHSSERLKFGTIYMLKIQNAKWNGAEFPVLRIELQKKPDVVVSNKPRESIRLRSNVEMSTSRVEVLETTLRIESNDNKEKELVVEPKQIAVDSRTTYPTIVDIDFRRALAEARLHRLRVNLAAADGTELTTATKIGVPGLPAPLTPPRIDINLSSEFGGNLKPQFNLAGTFRHIFLGNEYSTFAVEPVVKFDVGLGATKSKNAIELSLPMIRADWYLGPNSGCSRLREPEINVERPDLREVVDSPRLSSGRSSRIPLPCYSEWSNRSWLDLYSIDITLGPKFEMDRKFGRINTLGAARFDFNFDRWQHSVADQRSYLNEDLSQTDLKDSQNEIRIKKGVRITPRIGFEAGRRVTGEVIEKEALGIRYNIDPFPIFRTYAGFTGRLELNYWRFPVTVSVSQDYYFLGYNEEIGEIKDNRLNLRNIRGLHPLAKATFDIAIDSAKRYSFSVGYENGRAAPNFEYLNVVKSGFRIIY